MKVIDFETIKKCAENMDPYDWYKWVDYACVHKGEFQCPPKPRLSQEGGDYFNAMPALFENSHTAILKMIGRHSLKDGEDERSVMMGDMLLYDSDTGILKALMDAEYITTLRTGVVGAHSGFLYAKKDFDTIGLIGLGNIMTVCFKTFVRILEANNIDRKITVKLYKHHDQEVRFMDRFAGLENISFECCDTYEDVISGSDIIFSAVTLMEENFAKDECFKEGVTVVPIHMRGFQNCDLFFDKVFTDDVDQIRGFKYFDKFKSLGTVTDTLRGKCEGRENDTERIIVYNYGIAIHDLYFADKIYELIDGHDVEYNYCKNKFFI